MDQESTQQSFPSIPNSGSINDNGKEEKITSSINSLLNNHENSSTIPSTIRNNPSINNETNSSSTPVTKKRTRRTGRPMRNKIAKESSNRNEPYTIPYSTRSQTQQLRQQAPSLTEVSNPSTIVNADGTDANTANSQVPTTERKKHCAKCKESASIAKIINSKMDRIEELVRNLKKVTDEISQNNHPSSLATTNKTFNSLDFSRMTIGDLQNLVMVVTNTIMTTTSPEASNLNIIKSEFNEEAQFLKLETHR
ncbi:hypothetical protein RclHR1_05890008 [Rhizophagus clarus]|nr:hypothetical protein RclHR1_05890008 [Rhizophagus clarus]